MTRMNHLKWKKKAAFAVLVCAIASYGLTGCSTGIASTVTDSTVNSVSGNGADGTSGGNGTVQTTNTEYTAALTAEYSAEALSGAFDAAAATKITLNGSEASVEGNGAAASQAVVTITEPGTYIVSGTLTEGQLIVHSTTKGKVRVVLNQAAISNSTTAPVVFVEGSEVILTLAEGTVNTVTDAARTTAEAEDYSAAIYSKADLAINGTGTLNVNAGYKDGITSKDDLQIVSGTIHITAADDGMVGKDLLSSCGGTVTITAGGDGMKSTEDTDTAKGNIILSGGDFKITVANDGIQSENILQIENAQLTIQTAGGAAAAALKTDNNDRGFGRTNMAAPAESTTASTEETSDSYKALKAAGSIYVYSGTLNIDAQDDAFHSNGDGYISGGTWNIQSGDDAIHVENALVIDNGDITITKSNEGIEGATITVNGGKINLVSSDDGFNASDSSTASANPMAASASAKLIFNGGDIYVNASGDGMDSNGTLEVNGGTILVDGPSDSGNGALDYGSGFTYTGGTVIAFGASGMATQATQASNGGSAMMTYSSSQNAGTVFTVKKADGTVIASATSAKSFNNVVICSPMLAADTEITLSANDSATTVTLTDSISYINESGLTTGGQGGFGGGMKGQGGSRGQKNMTGTADGAMPMPDGTAPDVSNMQKPGMQQ